MNVEEKLAEYGFRLSAGCSGKASYTKFVQHEGKRAYISVTSLGSDSFPTTFEEPVHVVTYELRSGDELGPGRDFNSLQEFIEKLGQ
jgi:hypothetical protein